MACVFGLYLVWLLELMFLSHTGITATAANPTELPASAESVSDLFKTFNLDATLIPIVIAVLKALASLVVTVIALAILASAISNIDLRNMGTFKLHRQLRAEQKAKR